MIREKGEALSPVKINRNVWSNSAARVKGLFTVSGAPLGLQPTGLGPARGGGWGPDRGDRKEKMLIMVIKTTQTEGAGGKGNKMERQPKLRCGWSTQCLQGAGPRSRLLPSSQQHSAHRPSTDCTGHSSTAATALQPARGQDQHTDPSESLPGTQRDKLRGKGPAKHRQTSPRTTFLIGIVPFLCRVSQLQGHRTQKPPLKPCEHLVPQSLDHPQSPTEHRLTGGQWRALSSSSPKGHNALWFNSHFPRKMKQSQALPYRASGWPRAWSSRCAGAASPGCWCSSRRRCISDGLGSQWPRT